MIKLMMALLWVMLLAVFAAFLAGLDTSVVIPLGDWQFYMPLGLLLGGTVFLFFLGAALAWLWMRLRLDFPLWGHKALIKRQSRGFKALNQALVALAAGRADLAEQLLGQAEKKLPPQPLLPLLGAEIALRAGRRDLARTRFKALETMPDGRLLGLRGLALLGQTEGHPGEVLALVRQIVEEDPSNLWALETWFTLEASAGHWQGALAVLDKSKKQKLFPKQQEDQHRAALALAQAREALLKNHTSELEQFLKQALKYRPDFTPALLMQAQLLKDQGERTKAEKIVMAGYKKMPHPALIDSFKGLMPQALAAERLERIRKFVRGLEGHPLSLQAVGEAALEAGEIAFARENIAVLSGFPPRKGRAQLMLQLAKRDGTASDLEVMRLEKAILRAPQDAHWACASCGKAQDHWAALCGNCGAFDPFFWEDDQHEGTLIRADNRSDSPENRSNRDYKSALLLLGPEATAHPEPRPKR